MLPAYREMVDELEDQYVWIYVDFDRPRKRILAKLGMVNEKWGGSVYYTAYCEDSLSGQEGWSVLRCNEIERICPADIAEP